MTICLAAISFNSDSESHTIVTVSDTKLTRGFYSQDIAAMKFKRIHKYWTAMIAGKFSQHHPIITAIRAELSEEISPSLREVADACSRVYIAEGKRLAEESVLARYDLSMEQFLLSRQSLGDSLFERLWEQIARVEIGCELLVCGFDDTAHIFCVANPTAENPSFITYHDSPGFAAIGTGSYLAESTLYAFRQNVVTGLNETIYNTTVAKFVAESASDVGEHTVLLAFDESGNRLHYEFGLEEKLRARWLTKGKPKAPDDALQMIADAIKEAEPLPATPSAPRTSEPEQ